MASETRLLPRPGDLPMEPGAYYVPPQSQEAEQVTLACMCVDVEGIDIAQSMLSVDDFYAPNHRDIFKVLVYLREKNRAVDYITLMQELVNRGQWEQVGGEVCSNKDYIDKLLTTRFTAENIEWYAAIVKEKSILRQLDRAGRKIITLAHGEVEVVQDVVSEAQGLLLELTKATADKDTHNIAVLTQKVFARMEERAENGTRLSGLGTGFPVLDDITGGWQKEDLIIIAARPSMGKTSFAVASTLHIVTKPKAPVLFVSLETGGLKITERMISSIASVDSRIFRTGFVSPEDYDSVAKASQTLYDVPLEVCDSTSMTPVEVGIKARAVIAQYGRLGAIFIDHLGKMRPNKSTGNEVLDLGLITYGLKCVARDLKVPVILLVQLSRGVERREDHTPGMADLRGSGKIEEDADIVAFLYNEQYYSKTKPDISIPQEVQFIIGKHREGEVGIRKINFIPKFARYEPLTAKDELY